MLTLEEVRSKALALGWDDAGATQATIPEVDVSAWQEWVMNGRHGTMQYMENDLRSYPEKLLPGAKTAILFVSNYKQPKYPFESEPTLVASYARGRDYHNVHRSRLKVFVRWLEEISGQQGVAVGFSDTKPLLEKALCVKAGLGWFGKNTLLIHRQFGTFTLISGVLTTLELDQTADHATRQMRCGTCTRCLDACPTQALVSPYQLDATRCLSYHLIESKDNIPSEIAKKNPGYIFGCDICQDVCPHNVRSPFTQQNDFAAEKGLGPYIDVEGIEETTLWGTPLKRRGYLGLKRSFSECNKSEIK